MELYIFAIYDKIAQTYSELKLENNIGTAHRWFSGVMAQAKVDPTDFDLFRLGTYNVDSGVINATAPEFIEHGERTSE